MNTQFKKGVLELAKDKCNAKGYHVAVPANEEACIGCGMCIDVCPEVFEYNDDSKSEAINENITDAGIYL